MAIGNTLTQEKKREKIIEYTAGNETVKLSRSIIRDYLVNGDASKITDQEIVMFLNLCRFQHLNPFLREAYLVKYGNSPATMVTGKDAFAKRAQRNEKYRGFQAGVVVQNSSGELENRIGSLVVSGETLVGGWAKAFVDGYSEPIEISVSLEEYIGRKSDGTANSQWTKRPATMIRKVAFVQVLREAFSEDFAGMYSQEEMEIDTSFLDETPIEAPESELMPASIPTNDPFAE